jgi:hypothetical protein
MHARLHALHIHGPESGGLVLQQVQSLQGSKQRLGNEALTLVVAPAVTAASVESLLDR